MMEKLTIDELGYVEEMRKRLGTDKDSTALDQEIEEMDPMVAEISHELLYGRKNYAPNSWWMGSDKTAGEVLHEALSRPIPAAQAVPEGLVELLKAIRPEYGAVGSRDIDVAKQQKQIDAAIAILAAVSQPPADQFPSVAERESLLDIHAAQVALEDEIMLFEAEAERTRP